MAETSDFDPNALVKLKRDVGPTSLLRLVNKAGEGLRKTITALETHIDGSDWKACFHAIHTLRSTLATVGFKKQADSAESLELQCKNPPDDMNDKELRDFLSVLRDIDSRIMPDVTAYCEKLAEEP